MTFEVDVAGSFRTVTVDRLDRPGRFRVTVDGHVLLLDVSRPADWTLFLTGTVTFSGKVPVPVSTAVHVTPDGGNGQVLVGLDGRTATVTVNGRRRGHATDAGVHAHGDLPIVAPMPGRVVRVLVAAGDEIAARQPLVVVEAMKMENELRAPRAGRVKEVAVIPGTSVEAGRVLAVIE